MWTRECFVLLCFSVVCSVRPDSAVTGFGMELLLTKLNILQDRIEEIDRNTKLRESNQEAIQRARNVDLLAKLNALQNRQEEIDRNTKLRESNQEAIQRARNVDLLAKLNALQNRQEEIEQKMKLRESNQEAIENKLNRIVPYSSCKEIPTKVPDIYEIQFGVKKTKLSVYCAQHKYGGGWIVFQDRYTGKEDFNRNWTDYRNGFGDLKYEFWLGLENLHQLTTARPHELLVEVKDFLGNYGYAHYNQFKIASESEGYSLQLGVYNGTAGDALKLHSNMKFSTKDKDNDMAEGNCAMNGGGAWWFNNCSISNLNANYGNTTESLLNARTKEMHWHQFKNDWRSLSYSRMMIREVN